VTTALLLMFVGVGSTERARPAELQSMCASLLDARRVAESQGHIDFSVVIEATRDGERVGMTAQVSMGSPYEIRRIHFTGHDSINDSTLRRALTVRERDVFDVGQLRRSLARLNDLGLAQPVTLADIVVTKHADSATADITIPLRKRGRRWWSLSGPIVPGLGSYQAAISARLPPWGRGLLDASTYLVTFNVLALAHAPIGVLTFMSKAPPAVVVLERPYVPGQGWLSGFAVSPALSVRTTVEHYGRVQLGRGVRAVLADQPEDDTLAVPMVGSGRAAGEFVMCEPAPSRWRWLRRGAVHAIDIALAFSLP
jgi:hypothetical protein